MYRAKFSTLKIASALQHSEKKESPSVLSPVGPSRGPEPLNRSYVRWATEQYETMFSNIVGNRNWIRISGRLVIYDGEQ